jgi:two-component system CheB/CheR fusion protein
VQQSAAAANGRLSAASTELSVAGTAGSEPGAPIAVVGLGASAGGIQVLQTILEGIPRDSGLAFVVVMHLSPDFDSSLAEVLQTRSALPVVQVTERVRVEPNHAYVIPPRRHIAMEGLDLLLTEQQDPVGQRVAIDLFFRTLAASYGQRAVGVVLSGVDSDGSIGIKHIKEQGGVTIAQDPDQAEYDSMPRTAIGTGMVDWVLKAEDIAPRLIEFAHNERKMQLPPEDSAEDDPSQVLPETEKPGGALMARQIPRQSDEDALAEVLAYVCTRTGHNFEHYKRATVLRRVARRMQVNTLEDIPSYLAFLRATPSEAPALLSDLLINVTNFFRDPEAFAALGLHIPQLFAGKGEKDQVRVWVCGCATGEEAYTVAILLHEHASRLAARPSIQVFATDLDAEAIATARAGLYPSTIEADVSPERLRRFFAPAQGRYRVRQEIRDMVLFAIHDVLKDAPFSRLDLVTCRNLLIYLKREAQERVFDIFHFALRGGGLLFLGSSETLNETHMLFAPLEKKHRLYVRRAMARPGWNIPALPIPSSLPAPLPVAAEGEEEEGGEKEDTAAQVLAPQVLAPPPTSSSASSVSSAATRSTRGLLLGDLHLQALEEYAPPSVMVNENYDIVHLSPRAGKYLHLAGGEPSVNLLQVIHSDLRVELRAALFRASQSGEPIVAPRVRATLEGTPRLLTLQVRPLPNGDEQGLLLVVFEDADDPARAQALAQAEPAPSQVLGVTEAINRELEAEVEQLKMQLSSSVEQYEASTEELKASNEEMQAMNEELRSTAEELQTSKEELQSVNEELSTVNYELKANLEELARANSDLQNLLSSIEIGTIFLDRQGRLKKFTPRVQELFNLIPSDIGRPLSDITHNLEHGGFAEDAAQVLRTLTPVEREVQASGGLWFIARLLPYRTQDDRIDGVVLTFVDITRRKQAEDALRESEARQKYLVRLSDALRPLSDTSEVQAAVAQVLGEHLGADRAYYVELDEAAREVVVARDWHRPEASSHARRYPLNEWPMPWLSNGAPWVMHDVDTDPALPDDRRGSYHANDIGAAIVVPFIKDERLVAMLVASQQTPRAWTAAEVTLVEESVERAWAAVEWARAKESLARSEEKYRTLFSSMDEGYFLVNVLFDEDGRPADVLYLDANPAATAMVGQDFTGRRLREISPDYESYWFEIFGRVALTGESTRMERYAEPDGKWYWFYVLKVGDQSNGENSRRVAVVFRDITERKRAEEALRESESRLRTLSDAVPQIIWTNDGEGKANYFNRRWFDYSGLSLEESMGPGWQTIVHPEDAVDSKALWRRALEVGEVFDTEYRLRRHDGTYRWFIGRNVPLRDVGGRVTGWFGTATDIEDLKSAEATLRETEERFRLVVEGVKDYAMFLMDAQRCIVHWNTGAERVFGWTREEVLGESGDIIFTLEDQKAGAPEQEAQTAVAQGSAPDVRWHRRKDGSLFWAEGINTSLRHESGMVRGFAKVTRDATREREAREAVRQAHEDLQAAHGDLEARVQARTAELRGEMTRRQGLEHERERLLRGIVAAQEEERRRLSRELHDQMGQTLTALALGLKMLPVAENPGISRPTPAERLQALHSMAEDLANYAHHLAWELRPAVLDNIGLEAALQQYVSDWGPRNGVAADFVAHGTNSKDRLPLDLESTLYRVLQEGLSNVARHAGASQVSVVLERRVHEVRVVIEDNGQGFDPEQSTNRLGIVGMRERLELVHGTLTIESAPGEGTVVYARVPLQQNQAAG